MEYMGNSDITVVFPVTLDQGGVSYTKKSTETLLDTNGVVQFQWCEYGSIGGDYILRFSRVDNTASPPVYYYDEVVGESAMANCQLSSLVSVATMWNTV